MYRMSFLMFLFGFIIQQYMDCIPTIPLNLLKLEMEENSSTLTDLHE